MTMPYWAERLRIRLIHELGGYTAEDVEAEVDTALRYGKPQRKADFVELSNVADFNGFDATLDPSRISRMKDVALGGIAKKLKESKYVRYRIVPWLGGRQALQAKILVTVPHDWSRVDDEMAEKLYSKLLLQEVERCKNAKR
jgi:hypothetical protein